MNSRERVLTALRLGQPDRVPFVEGEVNIKIQRALMGKDTFLPEEVNEVMGLDNLIVLFRPPTFAETHEEDGIPYITKPLITSRADLDKMVFPDPDDPALYIEAAALIRRNQGKYAVAANMRVGVSAMLLSMGLDNFSYALADDPGFVDTALGRFCDWTVAMVGKLRDFGVDYIWTFDDIAYHAGPMFSPRVFRSLFLPHMRRVADAIHDTGLPWIYHSDGNLMAVLDDLLSLGMQGLHPLEPGAMDIEAMKRDYGQRICLVGNIDLHYTLTRGTPEEVDAEVKRRIEVVGQGGGYMISSANSIVSYCKVENVRAMVDAIRKYGAY